MTFKEYFLMEETEEVTKVTNLIGTYKIKYEDGVTERYRLNEYPFQPVVYALIDKFGYLHSPDSNTPAIESVDTADKTKVISWYKHGLIHRDGDLPAEQEESINEKGVLVRVVYAKNGKKHRLTGPAVVGYYDNTTFSESYYINGKLYTKEEFDKYVSGLNKDQAEMLGDLGQTFD
jgi:hypothetical protein